jgi:hypothetical protein
MFFFNLEPKITKETLIERANDAISIFTQTVKTLEDVNLGLEDFMDENNDAMRKLQQENDVMNNTIARNQNIIDKINNIVN